MRTFEQVEASGELLGLDELVSLANALLPLYQPGARSGDGRQKEEVSARLVRHLTTLGLLDEAGREGREARYTWRHLLQLLVARRLQAEGYSTGATKKLMSQADDDALKRWLFAGVEHLSAGDLDRVLSSPTSPAAPISTDERAREASGEQDNAALQYLQGIRVGSAPASPGHSAPPTVQFPPTRWTRIEVEPGLEVQVRSDYVLPTSPSARDALLKRILDAMAAANQAARRKR